jgi:hypothetical protein
LAGEFRRGAAKYQECRWVLGAVSKNTKDRKQPRLSLGLVDDHQSFKSSQNGLGIFHEPPRQRVFEVKIVEVVRWEYLAGKRGFPALPGPNECDHRVPSEGANEGLLIQMPGNHSEILQLRCMISIKYTSDVSVAIWQVRFALRWARRGYLVPRGIPPPKDGPLSGASLFIRRCWERCWFYDRWIAKMDPLRYK